MTVSRRDYLEEVAEADADGSVAAVYADIRRVLGVPFVMLIYRALATDPARLQSIWSDVAPNLADLVHRGIETELSVASSGAVVPVRRSSPAVADLDPERAASTLACYRRANSANVVVLHALLQGVDAPAATSSARSAERLIGPILPMADINELAPAARRSLEAMSATITGGEQPIVIPSLLRHFAYDQRLPSVLLAALRPVLLGTELDAAVASIVARAAERAGTLPYRVSRVEDPGTRAILERFARTIPAMIVTGALIAQALRDVIDYRACLGPSS